MLTSLPTSVIVTDCPVTESAPRVTRVPEISLTPVDDSEDAAVSDDEPDTASPLA